MRDALGASTSGCIVGSTCELYTEPEKILHVEDPVSGYFINREGHRGDDSSYSFLAMSVFIPLQPFATLVVYYVLICMGELALVIPRKLTMSIFKG